MLEVIRFLLEGEYKYSVQGTTFWWYYLYVSTSYRNTNTVTFLYCSNSTSTVLVLTGVLRTCTLERVKVRSLEMDAEIHVKIRKVL
jgi:hypothetical protein